MAGMYDVLAKVISQQGTCFAGHKVGDEWLFDRGMKSPAGLCNSAFAALFPHIRMLQGGGGYDPEIAKRVGHGELEPGAAPTLTCPDADNPLVFRLQRLPK